jgi:uncharacterized C2H2 Zn-finger protein
LRRASGPPGERRERVWGAAGRGSLRMKMLQSDNGGVELSRCPRNPDETAEAYLMDRLPAEQVVRYEEHYLGCPRCAERLEFTQEFIVATGKAAQRLRGSTAAST